MNAAIQNYDKALNLAKTPLDHSSAHKNLAVSYNHLIKIETKMPTKVPGWKEKVCHHFLMAMHEGCNSQNNEWIAKVFKAFEESNDEIIGRETIISNALHLSPMINFKPFNQYATNFFHACGEDILSQALEKMSNKDFRSGLPLLHDIHRPLEEAEKFNARMGSTSEEVSKEVSLLRKEYQSFLAIGEALQSYDWGQKIVEKLEASEDPFDSDSDDNDWFRGERDSCGGVPKFKRNDEEMKSEDSKEEQSEDDSDDEDTKDDDPFDSWDNFFYGPQFDATTESDYDDKSEDFEESENDSYYDKSEDESVDEESEESDESDEEYVEESDEDSDGESEGSGHESEKDFDESEESKNREKHFGNDEPSSKKASKVKESANENEASHEEPNSSQKSGLYGKARHFLKKTYKKYKPSKKDQNDTPQNKSANKPQDSEMKTSEEKNFKTTKDSKEDEEYDGESDGKYDEESDGEFDEKYDEESVEDEESDEKSDEESVEDESQDSEKEPSKEKDSKEDENVLDLAFEALDLFTKAISLVRGKDCEIIAMAETEIGLLHYKFFKNTQRAKDHFKEAFDLCKVLQSNENLYKNRWYTRLTKGMQRIQEEAKKAADAEREKLRKPHYEKLQKNGTLGKIFRLEHGLTTQEMMEKALEEFPPKHIKDWESKKDKISDCSTHQAKKKALLTIISLYHPDKVQGGKDRLDKDANIEEYMVICEEITKILNGRYQNAKML